jgi:hypothetical protein
VFKSILLEASYIPSFEVLNAIKFGLHTLRKLNTITKLPFDVRMRFVGPLFVVHCVNSYSLVT